MKKESEQKELEALDTRKMKQSREKYIKVDTLSWIGARQDAKGKDWLWPDGTCGHIFPIVKGFH